MINKVKISELPVSVTGKGAYVPAVDNSGKTVKVSLNGLTDPAFRSLEYNNDSTLTELENRELTRLQVPKDERITGMTVTYRISAKVITEQHKGWSLEDSAWKLAMNWGEIATSDDINSKIGANNGICPLDSSGHVASHHLPDSADEVIEIISFITVNPQRIGLFYNLTTKKTEFYEETMSGVFGVTESKTPDSGKIYVNITDNKLYRWNGSTMTVISETLGLGYTNTTAFRGSMGKLLYDWYDSEDPDGNVHYRKLVNLPSWVCGAGRGEVYPEEPFVLSTTATDAKIDFRFVDMNDGTDGMGNFPLVIPASTSEKAGLMTAEQFNRLNGIKEKLVYDFSKILYLKDNASKEEFQDAWTPLGKSSPIVPSGENSRIYDFEFCQDTYMLAKLVSLYDAEDCANLGIMYNNGDGLYAVHVYVDFADFYRTKVTTTELIAL